MAKVLSNFESRSRRMIWFAVVTAVAAVGMVPIVRAFKIGAGSPDIHESITGNAIIAVMPQADPMFVINVKSGNYNTDFSHHIAQEFHFDNSTAGNGNGGFTNGFNTIYDMLNRAAGEATVCDANRVCSINPLFLNPQHSSFGDLAQDIGDTYFSLSLNSDCLSELACPSVDFAASSASMGALSALLVTNDPDPDQVVASVFAPLNIQVENYGDELAEKESSLDTLLGRHCRPDWAGGMCFETLELMAPGDDSFQKLAAHLRILQYEYLAYYAWQHLGHAFHTTQDFFAHSNYVEIAGGRKGPPCDPSSYQSATICDAPLDTNSGRWDAIRLPTDEIQSQLPAVNVAGFVSVFSTVDRTLNNLPSIFGGDLNFKYLQTGYYPCGVDVDPVGNTGGAAPYNLGFLYCHTATPSGNSSPGMNKDKRYEPGDDSAVMAAEHRQINRQNFDWAAISAQRTSVVLFESFLFSLPAGSNFISAASARAASQRQGEMAWLAPPRIGPATVAGGILRGGLSLNNLGAQHLTQNLQLAQMSASVCTTLDGKSCLPAGQVRPPGSPLMDIVTVTTGGTPVGGATVSVSGQTGTAITNASGAAVINHQQCLAEVVVPPGKLEAVPAPCGGTVSMAGYQPINISLP